MTNVIMGFAHGKNYRWEVVRPFVKSLREVAKFDGDVVLFTNSEYEFDGKKQLKEYGVKEMPVNLGYVPDGQGFMMARFWHQEKTIKENVHWNRVFLVDTRDMIFQSDLSRFFADDGLHCAKESIEIWQDFHFNSAGIKASWGDGVFEKMKNKTVLNSGSFWGGRDIVLRLLNEMHSCGAAANCDQHALMYCIYRDENPIPATLHDNDGSWIWTMAMSDVKGCKFENGLVHTPDGRVPSIVHQYDRFEDLKTQILEYYNDKV